MVDRIIQFILLFESFKCVIHEHKMTYQNCINEYICSKI